MTAPPNDEERTCETCAWFGVDCRGHRLNTRGCEEINGLPMWEPLVDGIIEVKL